MSDTSNGRIPHPGGYEQVTVAGQTVKFTRINSGIREDFAAWAMHQAYERLEKLRPRFPKVDYFRRLKALDDAVNSGAYDWGFPMDQESCGSAIWQARMEGEGPARLAQMLLEEHHPKITGKEIGALFAAAEEEAIESGQPNKLTAALNRALDPNSASPSQEETGETAKTTEATPTA